VEFNEMNKHFFDACFMNVRSHISKQNIKILCRCVPFFLCASLPPIILIISNWKA